MRATHLTLTRICTHGQRHIQRALRGEILRPEGSGPARGTHAIAIGAGRSQARGEGAARADGKHSMYRYQYRPHPRLHRR